MVTPYDRRAARLQRHRRVRRRVAGTPERPRLVVFRSHAHIYASLVDDLSGHTLLTVSTLDPSVRASGADKKPVQQAKDVGLATAARAKERGIGQVVFDRGGYLYHGRVAAVAEGAREGGLEF